jgi:hypothetical protein
MKIVDLHVGAGYHSEAKKKLYQQLLFRGCKAAMEIQDDGLQALTNSSIEGAPDNTVFL